MFLKSQYFSPELTVHTTLPTVKDFLAMLLNKSLNKTLFYFLITDEHIRPIVDNVWCVITAAPRIAFNSCFCAPQVYIYGLALLHLMIRVLSPPVH
jgi:hypothetical protein